MNNFVFKIQIRNFIIFICVLFTFKLYAQDDSLIVESKKYGFYNCPNSEVPIFNIPTDSIIEIDIKTDFHKLFNTKKDEQKRIQGTLSYYLKGERIDLPIKIKAKGKSRFLYCNYKPLDIKFSSSAESTIFGGLDEKLIIRTQCGDNGRDQWIFEGTKKEHRNRLLAEYYIYSILETLETTTHSVSLCKIKYINNNDSILTQELAFFIEDDEDVAKRCELKRKKKKKKIHYLDEASFMNTDLINQFIMNYDWIKEYSDTAGWIGHNIEFLTSKDNISYLLPYDFDLNTVTYPDYWKNKKESFDEHCYLFQEILTNQYSDKNKLEAPYLIFKNIPEIKTIIEDSYIDTVYKEKFIYWIDSYEFILFNHLSQYKKYKNKLYIDDN